MPATDLTPTLQRLRDALSAREDVLEAYVFGSVARGEAQAHSDLDVAVYLEPDAVPGTGWGVAAELTAMLMGALNRNDIDLVVLNGAPPVLYHRVLRDGVRVFARDLQQTTVREGRALSVYCDYVPQLAKIEAAHRERIAAGKFGR